LRQTAHEVDLRQTSSSGAATGSPASGEEERILIYVTESPNTAGLIRRGRRVADYLRGDCFAVAVVPGAGLEDLPAAKRDPIERHLEFARKLHIETRVLSADDPADALVGFARTNAITQIFLAKPERARSPLRTARQEVTMKVIRQATDIQVTVVANRG
jgi:two-component system, OmpR family, sensor histidine kinase KdpD